MVVASATVLMTIWFIFQGWRMDTGKAVASPHEMKAAVRRDQVLRDQIVRKNAEVDTNNITDSRSGEAA